MTTADHGRPDVPVHRVCAAALHNAWDGEIEPALEVDPGDIVELTVPDASHGQIGENTAAADLASVDFSRMNPVAGPVLVRGARPDDVLEVEILDVLTRDWGWTAIVPGFGLLTDDFPKPWLRISRIEGERVLFGNGVELPCRPFPGTIGVVPDGPGPHPILPPTRFGGNIDIRHLTAGARLLLPVGVEGALLSVGDGHAVQGDGEVCGSAVETGMKIALRLQLRRDLRIAGPQLSVPDGGFAQGSGGTYVTTGVAEDLHEAARAAVRAMIDYLVGRRDVAPEEAYALTSVAADLRILEVVNAPRWVVGAAISEGIFTEQ
ncbi:MAG: acetamidase/formamidase family protein [Gaiellaceae bacterium]